MRFYGAVGYANSVEASPGVWVEKITEVTYFGEVIRDSRRLEAPPQVPPTLNGNISLENSFSIMADAEAYNNFIKMRYVCWEGQNWTITNVEVRRPRLVLTIGGPWNGSTPGPASPP
jgi:hypothetical protein